ncbi:MAG: thrombospondin type 3 repeat-containing protein [Nannocystaceae bacterium]
MRSVDSKQEAPMGIVRASLVASALAAATAAMPGCITDPDCGICDPENLILETIAASNYAGKEIYILSPECKGDACPEPLTEAKYYVNTISQCEVDFEDQTERDGSPPGVRGADEWCKISPLLVNAGLNFVFNNLLDPQSIELVRKDLANPQLFEVYNWKTRILKVSGPVTRFNGDYFKGNSTTPDLITRSVNLSCIENLADAGQGFDHNSLNNQACDGFYFADGGLWPLRTRLGQDIKAFQGWTDWRSQSNSCEDPDEGPNTCCHVCDYELAVNISRYGAGRSPGGEQAPVACDPANDDKFTVCRQVVPEVDRSAEDRLSYNYLWNGEMVSSAVPMEDRLRETHPDDRPDGAEQKNVPCSTNTDCTSPSGANLPGSECVGQLENSGVACSQDTMDEACVERKCVAEWFISCETTQLGGYCVDKRYDDNNVAGCFQLNNQLVAYNGDLEEGQTKTVAPNQRLAYADLDENGVISTEEGCGQGNVCDPFADRNITTPVRVYDRKRSLPEQTRDCVCPTNQSGFDAIVNDPENTCADVVAKLCSENGNGSTVNTAKADQYATSFRIQSGGVIYDPSLKGVAFRPADTGTTRRALAEDCASGRGHIGGLNIKDGWRANDSGAESTENFDRALCSSSEYDIVFAVPSDGEGTQYIEDKVGNTLAGRRTYRFTTPDFHVVPGSGFPANNLRIGACDEFEISFSNKFDMSPHNLRKLQLVETDGLNGNEIRVVAGGLNCTEDPDAVSDTSPPCLTIDVAAQAVGKVGVQVNPKDFGQALRTGQTYRLKVPGIANVGDIPVDSYKDFQDAFNANPDAAQAAYMGAFWDACGMPLIVGGASEPDYFYDFLVDPPKAKEDKDGLLGQSLLPDDTVTDPVSGETIVCDRLGDAVQFSCDNAPNHYNPDQIDSDLDGFGDIYDLCPTIPTTINTADSDKDGVGNECDTCVKQPNTYNKEADMAGVPPYMMVFNTPHQGDADGDGIGDACDNCVQTPNCGMFGNTAGLTPYKIGDVTPLDNTNICQTDIDGLPMIGDACVENGTPITYPGAAGPVGFGNDDDFDGDGIRNVDDYCPRIPVEGVACNGDDECPGTTCTNNVCNHSDVDGDKVGDICDTCPFDLNPNQIADGGIQEDDEDGDFVGRACETDASCYDRADPRPYSFYDVSVNGWCCTALFDEISQTRRLREPYAATLVTVTDTNGNPVFDEDNNPVQELRITGGGRFLTADCASENEPDCVKIPDSVLSKRGMVTLPEGCEAALIDAGYDPANKIYAKRLSLSDVSNEEELWANRCTLPQLDQDFDGVADVCDLCPFAFDPGNEQYVNENGRLFPMSGRFCNGAYALDQIQEALTNEQSACWDAESDMGGTTGGDTGDTGTTGG